MKPSRVAKKSGSRRSSPSQSTERVGRRLDRLLVIGVAAGLHGGPQRAEEPEITYITDEDRTTGGEQAARPGG